MADSFAPWIEELYGRDGHRRLPDQPAALLPRQRRNTRGQMAVFLVKTFGLQ